MAGVEAARGRLARRPPLDLALRKVELVAQFPLFADLDEAVTLVNRVAPEHLELSVADPEALARKVRHAGAIFLGRYTAEVLGDYCAGPNHVLPTARTARFFSPLGVYDFQKRSSIIKTTADGSAHLGVTAALLARAERLTAHARSAEYRVQATAPQSDEQTS